MLVEPLRVSTCAPVINFVAPAACLPARQSTVQKLCSDYERALAEFKTALAAFGQAENAALAARPRPDSLIRPTKRNFADVPDYTAQFTSRKHLPSQRIPITSGEIRREIKSIKNNTVKEEGSGKTRTITVCENGFPLTAKQKARLARVEARLPIALAYEAEVAAIEKRFRVKELDAAAQVPSRRLGPLAARIADTPSQDRHDMLAKARICEIDPDVAEVSEDIAMSIARDFARLAAAGAV